jgi:hypothetical protein
MTAEEHFSCLAEFRLQRGRPTANTLRSQGQPPEKPPEAVPGYSHHVAFLATLACGFPSPRIAVVCRLPKSGKSRSLALLVVFFSLVGTAVESVCLLCHFAPLILLGGGHYMGAFTTEQLQAWAYLSLRWFEYGFSIALVFFGFYCLAMGYLIFRSSFAPRIIGVLLAIEAALPDQ